METQKRMHLSLLILLTTAAVFAGWYIWAEHRNTHVVVEWSTASELDTVGFNLYRSETKEGAFQQINTDLIPTSSDPLGGSSYTYRDEAVVAGRVYYYLLEDVAANGATNRHGPIEVRAEGVGVAEGVLMALLGVLTLIGWADWYLSTRRLPKATNPQE